MDSDDFRDNGFQDSQQAAEGEGWLDLKITEDDITPENLNLQDDTETKSEAPLAGQSYRVGERIGNEYEIRSILGGEGNSGMGVVYVCYSHQYQQVLALKTLQDRFLTSKEKKDMFKKEALAWTLLERHPYIVSAHLVEVFDSRIFVSCEFIAPDDEKRNTLGHYLHGFISVKQALTWTIQFCHAMEHACEKGVTPHRDIKPENLMITEDGTLKVTDFGLAGVWTGIVEADIDFESFSGEHKGFTFLKGSGGKIIAGTPPYMAPEQFKGRSDARSDIYAFGVVLYQMFARGELPLYPEVGQEWEDVHSYSTVPSLEKDNPASAYLNPIIQKCLEKNPVKRYQDFHSLRHEVEKCYREIVTKTHGDEVPVLQYPKRETGDLINKGVSLACLDLYDQAIEAYLEGVQINPDSEEARLANATARFNLVSTLSWKGLMENKSIAKRLEASMISIENTQKHSDPRALEDKRLIYEAIAEYDEGFQTNLGYARAHYSLGDKLIRKELVDRNIKDEILDEFSKACEINPNSADASFHIALYSSIIGLVDDAIASWRETLRINPDNTEAYYNLGVALTELVNKAIGDYQVELWSPLGYSQANNNLCIALKDKRLLEEAVNAFEEFMIHAQPQHAELAKLAKGVISALKILVKRISELWVTTKVMS